MRNDPEIETDDDTGEYPVPVITEPTSEPVDWAGAAFWIVFVGSFLGGSIAMVRLLMD